MDFNYACLTPIPEDLLDLLENSDNQNDPAWEKPCTTGEIIPLNGQEWQMVQPTKHKPIQSIGNMEYNCHSFPPVHQGLFHLLNAFDQPLCPMNCDQVFSSSCTPVGQDVSNIDVAPTAHSIIPSGGTMKNNCYSLSPLPEDFFDVFNNTSQSLSPTDVRQDVSNIGCSLDLEGRSVPQDVSPLKEEECLEVQSDLVPTEPKNISSNFKAESNYCLSPEEISDLLDFIDKSLPPQLPSYIKEDDKVWANDTKSVVSETEKDHEEVKSSIVPSREYGKTVPSELTSNSDHFCITFKQSQPLCVCDEGIYSSTESKFMPIEYVDNFKQKSSNSTAAAKTLFVDKQNTDIKSSNKVNFSGEMLVVPYQINVRHPEESIAINGILASKTLSYTKFTKSGNVSQNNYFGLEDTKIGAKQSDTNVSLKAVVCRKGKKEDTVPTGKFGVIKTSERANISKQIGRTVDKSIKQGTELNLQNSNHSTIKPRQLTAIANSTGSLDNCSKLNNVEKEGEGSRKVVLFNLVPVGVQRKAVDIKEGKLFESHKKPTNLSYLGHSTVNESFSINKQEPESSIEVPSTLSSSTEPTRNITRKVTMIKTFSHRKIPKADTLSEVAEVKSESPSLYAVDKQNTIMEYSEGVAGSKSNRCLSLGNSKEQNELTNARNVLEQVKNRKDPIRNLCIAVHKTLKEVDGPLPMKKRKRSNIITVAGTRKKFKVLCSWNSAIIPKEFLKNSVRTVDAEAMKVN